MEIVLVDSNPIFLESLEFGLQHVLKASVKIRSFHSSDSCLHNIFSKPDIVIVDDALKNDKFGVVNVIGFSEQIKKMNSNTEIIFISKVIESKQLGSDLLTTDGILSELIESVKIAMHLLKRKRKVRIRKNMLMISIVLGLSLLAVFVICQFFK